MPSDGFTVAVIQQTASDDLETNLDRYRTLIGEAAGGGADVVLMPEFFSIPFVPRDMNLGYFDRAEPLGGPTTTMAQEASRTFGVAVVCSFFERGEQVGVHHNSVVVYDRGELAHHYRKSHVPLSAGFREKFYFQPGQEPPRAVTVNGVRVGVIICYERHFPEMVRAVAIDGAELVAIPNASASAASRNAFEAELRGHALANGLFVAIANRVGEEDGNDYFGNSAVYGPDGTRLGFCAEAEGVILVRCDRAAIREQRVTTPIWRDRRPELYDAVVAPTQQPLSGHR